MQVPAQACLVGGRWSVLCTTMSSGWEMVCVCVCVGAGHCRWQVSPICALHPGPAPGVTDEVRQGEAHVRSTAQ